MTGQKAGNDSQNLLLMKPQGAWIPLMLSPRLSVFAAEVSAATCPPPNPQKTRESGLTPKTSDGRSVTVRCWGWGHSYTVPTPTSSVILKI